MPSTFGQPVQPPQSEIEQFPQAELLPDPVDDNTDHEDVNTEHKADASGANPDIANDKSIEVA